jgi:hypothetical protein
MSCRRLTFQDINSARVFCNAKNLHSQNGIKYHPFKCWKCNQFHVEEIK